MKRRLAIALLLLALPALAADWRDELTPPQPGKFPALRPLTATYKFGWGKLSAATAEFDFSRPEPGLLKLTVGAKSVGAVRALWRMDTQHEALARAGTLQPLSLVQVETYKSEVESTHATFDAEGVSRLHESKPAPKTQAKVKRFKCPDVFDLHTALLFIRSQPLEHGDHYSFVVYPSTSPYLAEVAVIGRERLKAAGTSYDAVKLEVRLRAVKKDLTLAPHKKFKQAQAWISDDRDRLLLRVEAEVFVGSVWAEMERVDFAED